MTFEQYIKEEREDAREEGREEGRIEGRIEEIILQCRESGKTRDMALQMVMKRTQLDMEQAKARIEQYWK